MSRYTSATDADRQEMLDAIGVESIDELFDAVPEGVRLDRPLDLPPGKPEQEVYARLRELAARNVSHRGRDQLHRRRHVRPLRAEPDRLDPLPLRVPDAVHALPARDLPGRAAGDVRVPDRDLRADRPAGLQRVRLRGAVARSPPPRYLAKLHNKRSRFLVSAGVHPHSRETLETTSAGWGTSVEEIPLADGVTEVPGDRRRRLRRARAVPELPTAPSRTSRPSPTPPTRPAR